MNIAICIIAYNRLESLQNVLHSISKAYYDQMVTLIISVDKSDTDVVNDYADNYKWKYGEKHVIKHEKNLGLRQHVLNCGDFTKVYDGLIVLEDDVTVAESFFVYAKKCVEKYKENEKVAGISLYSFPVNYQNRLPFHPLHSDSDVFFMKCAQSWGQVWMPKQWKMFKIWYDKHCNEFGEKPYLPTAICSWPKNSWLKYHTRYCIEQNKYFVYPYVSLSTNNSDAGTHINKKSTLFQSYLLYGIKKEFNLNPIVRYDGFFENELLYEALGITKDELCVDFNDTKQNRQNKRYWLTRRHLSYKIIQSFALELCPYELNIYENRKGKDLFIYDTTIKSRNKLASTDFLFYQYIYHLALVKKIFISIIKTGTEYLRKGFIFWG